MREMERRERESEKIEEGKRKGEIGEGRGGERSEGKR
jgi:hypothetical protein